MKYNLTKKISYSIIILVLIVGLTLTTFFGMNGKGILAAKKIAAQLEFFLALLYPSGYNSKWKGFEPQNFSAFVPQHGIFSRWPRAAACMTTACRKIENVKL